MVIKMDAELNASGTSQRGRITATFFELCAVFGRPNGETDGHKVDAEWIGMIDEEVFTIYNYKTGRNYLREEGQPLLQIVDWNIGGHNQTVAEKVIAYYDQELEALRRK